MSECSWSLVLAFEKINSLVGFPLLVHTSNRQIYTSLLSEFESWHLLHPPHCSSRPELLLRMAWAVWNVWPASRVATAPGTGGGGLHGGSVVTGAPGRSHFGFRLWFCACIGRAMFFMCVSTSLAESTKKKQRVFSHVVASQYRVTK